MVLDTHVVVSITSNNVSHYIEKGYAAVVGTNITVAVHDLTHRAAIKVRVLCSTCGVVSNISYSSYYKRKNKHTCALCCVSTRKTTEYVAAEFSKRGYTLLTTEYINAHQKLAYICTQHPDTVQHIIYNSLQRGSGCRLCAIERRGVQRRLSTDDVMSLVNTTDYSLVSLVWNEKNTSKSRLVLRCPVHNSTFEVAYNNLQQGTGCPLCGRDKTKGKNNTAFKGETMYLSQYLRSYLAEWKLRCAAEAQYKCELSGLSSDITDFDIHHTVASRFIVSSILTEICGFPDVLPPYEYDLLEQLVPLYVERHNDVKGAFIAYPIHKLYHALYGVQDGVTPEQYLEFAADFKKGWIVFSTPALYRKNSKSVYKQRKMHDKASHSRNN